MKNVVEILLMHDAGYRLRDICERFATYHSLIQAVLRRNGRRPQPRRLIRGERLARVVEAYKRGVSARQIARAESVSDWVIRDAISRSRIAKHTRRLFEPQVERAILGDYLSGETSTSIALKHQCSPGTVTNLVRRHGESIRPKRHLSERDQNGVVQKYEEGASTTQIAAELGVSSGTVRRYVLERRRLRGPRESHRKIALDTKAFRRRTKEVAYWVGFLMADGNVLESGAITVGLQRRDRDHLIKLRRFLRSDARIHDGVVNDGAYKPSGHGIRWQRQPQSKAEIPKPSRPIQHAIPSA